ncbi:hypothetical protein QR680_011616 [Steinernema hermaphroditum]|uniref:Uncharacterized protein n=1 Tax=Steinernema hermaphroditum TaxID=289476 RepID=A0AA39HZ39_9BILA|nr:hypothetical protein QR680_011616 [Steinernema hermaphroditum]
MSVFCLDAPINSFECFEEQCLNDNEQLFGDNEQQFGDNEKQFDDNEQQFGDNEQQFHCLSRDTRTTALWDAFTAALPKRRRRSNRIRKELSLIMGRHLIKL